MNNKSLNFYALLALTVSSMVGSGIFAISSDIASVAALGPVFISWLITGFGITMLALTFVYINNKIPQIETGIVGYVKDGFGSFTSFQVSWGYWICAVLGNIALIVLLGETFANWFPIFKNGLFVLGFHTVLNLIVFIVAAKGIKEATSINTVLMFVKVAPIIIFCIFAVFAFDTSKVNINFWGNGLNLGSIFHQVKETMLITLWAFIGIEGAVMFTSRAKKRSQVGLATVIGVAVVLVMLIIVSIAPYGIVPYNELINLKNPSMGGIFSYIIGPFGKTIIAFTVILSILGALISWILVTSEILFVAAKQESAPTQFAKENKAKAPINSLIITVIVQQIFFIIVYFNESSFTTVYLLSTSMILIPYLFISLYGLVLSARKKGNINTVELLVFLFSTIFCIWLVYAAGLKYILLSSILYALTLIAYCYTRKQLKKPLFNNKVELSVAIFIIVICIYAISQTLSGALSL